MDSFPDRKRLISLLISTCPEKGQHLLINGRDAKKRIYDFLSKSGLGIDEAREIFVRPRYFLGDFSDLSESLKLALGASASFCDQEKRLTNLPSIRRLILMPIWKLGNIFISIASSLKHQIENPKKNMFIFCQTLLMKISFRLGRLLTIGVLRLSGRIVEFIRFCRFYKQPFFNALWGYLNVDTKKLCYSYIDSIPAHPALGPIYRCKDFSCACVVIIGIDLLPSSGKLYFLEANFNPGCFRPARLDLYNGNDPFGRHLIQYALSRGFRHINFYGSDLLGKVFDKDTAQLWENMARSSGISFKVLDYIFNGHFVSRDARIEIEFPRNENTLNVLARAPVSSSLTKLISEKGNLEVLIEDVNRFSHVEDKIFMPKRFVTPGEVLRRSTDNRFPNLIIRHRRKDGGSGIEFFNVDRVPVGYPIRDFVINEFIVPDLIKRDTRGKLLEFPCKYRSQILLTVDGPVYLGTYKVKSNTLIPNNMPKGKAENPRTYIANISLGGSFEKVDSEEDALCQKTSINIGKMISRFIDKKFLVEIEKCRQ